MTTKITSTSDPTLFAALQAKWEDEGEQGWVIYGSNSYRVLNSSTGSLEFLEYTPRELYDSRSTTGPKPASYKKLDEG